MARVSELAAGALRDLGLSPDVADALSDIQQEVAEAYREQFVEMVRAINRQASALNRIQTTLELLVRHLSPQLAGEIPPAIRVASEDEDADVASAVVVADPIGSGFTLSQGNLAKALGLAQPDVSVLCKAFRLKEDASCAVTVRPGKDRDIVNYHPRAVDRFRDLVRKPPSNLTQRQLGTLNRVRRRLGIG